MEKEKQPQRQYYREIRCPIHNKVLGRYDARVGIINATYYCPHCKREYTFTFKRAEK